MSTYIHNATTNKTEKIAHRYTSRGRGILSMTFNRAGSVIIEFVDGEQRVADRFGKVRTTVGVETVDLNTAKVG